MPTPPRVVMPIFSDDRAMEQSAAKSDRRPLKSLHYWGDKEAIGKNEAFMVDDACIAAMATASPSGNADGVQGQFGGNPLACDPDKHPDAGIIRAWLVLAHRTPDELPVIFWLAYIARNEWAHFPKRTPAEHRDRFDRIAALCRELRDALEATAMPFTHGEGYGLQTLNALDLLTKHELDNIVRASDHARGMGKTSHAFSQPERRLFDLFLRVPVLDAPTMQALLERLEGHARRIEMAGPLHVQPKKRGAERGYFVRRMGELFQRRYGEQPHEVIAALTTIALGEATDRELVAKLLAPRTL